MKLRYLFRALYADGTLYEQGVNDVSLTNPEKSAFFDVDQDKVIRFWIEGDGRSYLVDLTDGHFEIDGLSVWLGEQLPPTNVPLRLIFYRQHTHQFNIGSDSADEISHLVKYCIGWQATSNGKNFKEILGVF